MRHADAFAEHLSRRILILDGGMGTELLRAIQGTASPANTTGAAHLAAGALERLTLTHQALVRDVHEAYLAAGADIISTNTFCADAASQATGGHGDRTYELNRAAALLAKTSATAWTDKRPDRPRFVAGIIGPSLRRPRVDGAAGHAADTQARADTLGSAIYRQQVAGLIDGGVDVLLVETVVDIERARGALIEIHTACAARDMALPVIVSTVPALAAKDTEWLPALRAACTEALAAAPFGMGFNCGAGPDDLAALIPHLARADGAIVCQPSAGFPAADGTYPESPASFATVLRDLVGQHRVNMLGGCCGTSPLHIRALAAAIGGAPPRDRP
jgi:5-methyltetrahydrofolate--homocysteine methyltransferase